MISNLSFEKGKQQMYLVKSDDKILGDLKYKTFLTQ